MLLDWRNVDKMEYFSIRLGKYLILRYCNIWTLVYQCHINYQIEKNICLEFLESGVYLDVLGSAITKWSNFL